MRVTAKYKYADKDGYASLEADRLERENGMIYVYNGDKFIGAFDEGCLMMIYLA